MWNVYGGYDRKHDLVLGLRVVDIYLIRWQMDYDRITMVWIGLWEKRITWKVYDANDLMCWQIFAAWLMEKKVLFDLMFWQFNDWDIWLYFKFMLMFIWNTIDVKSVQLKSPILFCEFWTDDKPACVKVTIWFGLVSYVRTNPCWQWIAVFNVLCDQVMREI